MRVKALETLIGWRYDIDDDETLSGLAWTILSDLAGITRATAWWLLRLIGMFFKGLAYFALFKWFLGL